MKNLLFLILISNSLFAQDIFLHREKTNYSNRDSVFSITKLIAKADSLNAIYQVKGMSRVDVEYKNNRSLMFQYTKEGELKEFLETFEDTIYQSLKINKLDSSYSFHKYNGYFGNSHYEEYHYTKENTIEFWYYDHKQFDKLLRVFKVTTIKNKKVEKETVYKNFEGTIVEKHFILENNKWVLKKEETYPE